MGWMKIFWGVTKQGLSAQDLFCAANCLGPRSKLSKPTEELLAKQAC